MWTVEKTNLGPVCPLNCTFIQTVGRSLPKLAGSVLPPRCSSVVTCPMAVLAAIRVRLLVGSAAGSCELD